MSLLGSFHAAKGLVRPTGTALGRAALKGGKALVTSTPGRTAIGGGVGYGLGHIGGEKAEQQLGLDPGRLTNSAAYTGAALGASIASPWGRAQLHRLAGRTPEQAYRPVRDTANLLFKPTYPFEALGNAGAKTVARRIGTAMRAAPWAGGAVGLGVGASETAKFFPQMVTAQARAAGIRDPKVLDQIGEDTFSKTPRAVYQMFAPDWLHKLKENPTNVAPANPALAALLGVGKYMLPESKGWKPDRTAIGDIHRDAFKKFVLPDTTAGFNRVRKEQPELFGGIDTVRSLTPAGFLQTRAINALAKEHGPDRNKVMREVLLANRDKLVNAPVDALSSPLLSTYGSIFNKPYVMNDPGFRRFIGKNITEQSDKINKTYDELAHAGYNYSLDKYLNNKLKMDDADLLRKGIRDEIERVKPGPYYKYEAISNTPEDFTDPKYGRTWSRPLHFVNQLGREAVGTGALEGANALQNKLDIRPNTAGLPSLVQGTGLQSKFRKAYDDFVDTSFPKITE